ncbi:photosystem I subunit O [Dorcoceras hygrometricum]|uniref:Photosystem I subunit O n=1 Tax=Dorcoceras hygrometricum TaxID=472368 RepID=A0A2Z7ASL2_9LAMI|nr:photosystem I subunit O [Dorcoceras hygrometricum]
MYSCLKVAKKSRRPSLSWIEKHLYTNTVNDPSTGKCQDQSTLLVVVNSIKYPFHMLQPSLGPRHLPQHPRETEGSSSGTSSRPVPSHPYETPTDRPLPNTSMQGDTRLSYIVLMVLSPKLHRDLSPRSTSPPSQYLQNTKAKRLADWLRKDLNVIGFALIGWLAPSSIPLINGNSLTGLFFSSIGSELSHWPTGPALTSPFWLWLITWHLGLFLTLTFGQIGFKGRTEDYFN